MTYTDVGDVVPVYERCVWIETYQNNVTVLHQMKYVGVLTLPTIFTKFKFEIILKKNVNIVKCSVWDVHEMFSS